MKSSKTALIQWRDHKEIEGDGVWYKFSEVDLNIPICHSIGFIIKENKDMVVISHTISDDECITPFMILKKDIVLIDRYPKNKK